MRTLPTHLWEVDARHLKVILPRKLLRASLAHVWRERPGRILPIRGLNVETSVFFQNLTVPALFTESADDPPHGEARCLEEAEFLADETQKGLV